MTLPTRQQILDFIADTPGKVGKREIARAFKIDGALRIELKHLLREMSAEGLIDGARKSGLHPRDVLPKVGVIKVTGRDDEGNLLARAIMRGALLDGDDDPLISIDERPSRNRQFRRRILFALGDKILARLRKLRDKEYIASPIRKIEEAGGQIIGLVRQRDDGAWLIAVNRRERYDYRLEDGGGVADGDIVVAEKITASRNEKYGSKQAKFVRNLGSAESPHIFSQVALAEQDIAIEFAPEALAEAAAATPANLPPHDIISKLPFITIDPADARDHDDAVFAQADAAGGFALWVAIADVAHYVPTGSALDKAARERGNSVYLPDRVVPMLPEKLSNNLCSLKVGAWRAAMVVRMQVQKTGRIGDYQFYRAPIKVAAKLNYAQAQAAFDGQCPPDMEQADFADINQAVLQPLWQTYQLMAAARDQRAPLNLDKPEHRIELDEAGKIIRVHAQPQLEAHRLIEEFMVTANSCAAKILQHHKQPLIFRVHDTPSDERVRMLAEFLRPMKIKLALGQLLLPQMFNALLAQAKQSGHFASVCEAVLRTQAQANYSPENIGHFGLNLGDYAHFTSPIRRYADLTVHRALISALKLGGESQSQSHSDAAQLAAIAEHISVTERRAMMAERSAADRYLAAYMADKIGDNFSGTITGVSRAGIFVKLGQSGADGLVPISSLGVERFFVTPDKGQLVGGTSGLTFRIGQQVSVTLKEATPLRGGLLLALDEDGYKPIKTRPPKFMAPKFMYGRDSRRGRNTHRNTQRRGRR